MQKVANGSTLNGKVVQKKVREETKRISDVLIPIYYKEPYIFKGLEINICHRNN